MSAPARVLVCVFDGLRRDRIRPELMPNLCRFRTQAADFPESRAVFPTATRVNAAALGHGANPATTGLVANQFFDPAVFADRAFHTGKLAHYRAAQRAHGGRYLGAVAMGEAAAAAGLRTAVISTGSAGTTRWVNPRVEALGDVSLCLRDWRASTPADFAARLLERFGPIPPAGRPNAARIRRQTDMLLDAVLPEFDPDLVVMWFSDPDSTDHYCAIGSAESDAALRAVDAQFGRILDWWRSSPAHARWQVIVASDHGHVSATRRIDLKAEMAGAGLRLDGHFAGGADYAGVPGCAGAIRVRGGDPARLRRLAAWLADQPWCGLVFTAGGDGGEGSVPGTFARSLLLVDHPRAPELYYVMQSHEGANAFGLAGGTWFDSDVPEGGSTHGGLHLKEINNTLICGGARFRAGYVSPWPAGVIDIAPTALALLGVARPSTMTGRVLGEALTAPAAAEPPAPAAGGHSIGRRHLAWRRVGTAHYLDRGWTDGPGP